MNRLGIVWLCLSLLCGIAIAIGPQALRAKDLGKFRGSEGLQPLLRQVLRWGCQYQNVDPQQLATSNLDLVVIDMMLDEATGLAVKPADVRMMQRKPNGGRRLVLAYLSVGEAAEFRRYWRRDWDSHPPEWLGAANLNWPGSWSVRYWDSRWQEILFSGNNSLVDRILATGFDGVFLDRVDAYQDWRAERPSAPDDMIDLVGRLAERARSVRPEFLVMAQNSEHLLVSERYMSIIDAVSKESLLYGITSEGARNGAEDTAWSLSYLDLAKRAGLPIFVIEYLAQPKVIAQARGQLQEMGFIPFFANRLLDRLPAEDFSARQSGG
jgi:cysteinyl-tRNA synthetase, unknown class